MAKPTSQVMPQAWSMQVAAPFAGTSQTVPQAPQFSASVSVLTQLSPQEA
jgi:hypothetical protein